MNKNNKHSFVLVLTVVSLALAAKAGTAQMAFEDVSEATGMTGFTESWGASWGDMNNDNWPDLYVQGHRDFPRFYRNTGESIFQDVAYEKDPGNWINYPLDDKHGATFADYDNDGDDDLLQGVSATGPGQFLVNTNGTFIDRAYEADLNNDSSSRLPIWFDYDDDGHLDVAQMHTSNTYFRRRDPSSSGDYPLYDFDSVSSNVGFSCPGQLNYGQQLDVDGDGSLEVLCAEEGVFPLRVYDISTNPFTNVTSSIESESLVNSTIVADFNNDLLYDIVATRGSIRPSGATQVGSNRIEAWLRKDDSMPEGKGFDFASDGEITVKIDHQGMGIREQSKVYVLHPSGPDFADAGPVEVEYRKNKWEVRITTGDSIQVYLQIEAEEPITDLVEVDFDTPESPQETMHWVNSANNGLERTFNTGLYVPVYCGGAAAGDFDNDMDVDLYLVCRRGAENLPNRLYENQGDGTFVEVTGHGAEGPVGAGFEYGVGDGAFLADYDVDGFLDIFVANGLLYYPIGRGGPDTLIRNAGNANHWVQFDLHGDDSNRDGIGAKVYVTAGGVTQLREQNGGYARWGQNLMRLHVGLAGNTTFDVTVEWPSGNVDTFTSIAADALYELSENGTITTATMGAPVYTQLEAGDECGAPPYNLDYGPAVLLYKDCGSGIWTLRARGGREMEQLLFTAGTVEGDAPFEDISGFGLKPFDVLDNSTSNVLNFSVGTWYSNNKGFNFSTGDQTESCFNLDTQDIPVLIVGGSKKRIEPPFDLVTLGACALPPVVDDECGDPGIVSSTDHGFYVWKDCDYSGSAARWNISMSGGGMPWQPNSGRIASDVVIGATGNNLEGNDVVDSVPGDTVVDFMLKVGGSGIDGFQIDVPAGSSTCLVTEELPGAVSVYLGADRLLKTGNFDLLTLEACSDDPPAADPQCGEPTYNQGTEVGVWIWQDCAASGPDSQWLMRISGGGTNFSNYQGSLVSNVTLSATGFSIEGHDTLDSTPGDGIVDFDFFAGGNGLDGFEVTIPAGADACFDASVLPSGAQVVMGADNMIMPTPFDLNTLGACN